MVNLGIPKIKENSRIMKQNYDPPSIEKKAVLLNERWPDLNDIV